MAGNKNKLTWLVLPGIVLLFFYNMILLNMEPLANDTISYHPIGNWIKQYTEAHADIPFWYPYLFGGMPTLGSHIYTLKNPIQSIISILLFNRGLKYWFHFSLGGLGLYLLLRRRKLPVIPALFGGMVFALTPYLFGLLNAGHSSKIYALCWAPWVFAAVDYAIQTPKPRSIIFIGLAAALQLWAHHPQIVYYTWMIVVFWWIWNQGYTLIFSKNWNWSNSGWTSVYILSGLLIAFILVLPSYSSVYEFQKHSNRGAPSVLDKTEETRTGTTWEYATQWSFHPRESIAFIYPYFYGLQNYPTRDIKSSAYWGYMPFTQSTHYLGVLVILMAVLGALLKKPDRWLMYNWVVTGLILCVGFGQYFPLLFKPLFEWAPFFSKFRVPSMIYALLPLPMAILSAEGLQVIMTRQGAPLSDKTRRRVLWLFSVVIGITIILLLWGSSLLTFLRPQELSTYSAQVTGQLRATRQDLFQKGILLALFLTSGSLLAIWAGWKEKLNSLAVGAMLVGLTLVDFWVVNHEFIHLSPARKMEQQFRPNDVVEFLHQDQDLYRIYPVDDFDTNWYGNFNLASIGGYRPVKLRTYQDLIDAQGLNNLPVLNMLNVKYLITQREINHPDLRAVLRGTQNVYENLQVLPKAWVVGQIIPVNTQAHSLREILRKGFNPAREAVVVNYQQPLPDSAVTGTVSVKKYSENEISLAVNLDQGGVLVLSENYYKPGWKAYLDGAETEIYQTNHVLRSLYVPAGSHEVLFRYANQRLLVMLILSNGLLMVLILGCVYIYRNPILAFIKKRK